MAKVNWEVRFAEALHEITHYMTPAQHRREAGSRYGLETAESIEMAYENVLATAKGALKGYRRKKARETL